MRAVDTAAPGVCSKQAVSPKRKPSAVKQAELTRALRAGLDAGLYVSGYDVDLVAGRITVWTGTRAGADTEPTPLDKWMETHAR
jgi:hypothetical protein